MSGQKLLIFGLLASYIHDGANSASISMTGSTSDFHAPLAVAELLRGWSRPWCIAGGWALDLLRREVTRDHDDVEIAILRRDQHALRQCLDDWAFAKVDPPGKLSPWESQETLAPPVHEVHGRSTTGEVLEVLLNESDQGDWLYRREPTIRCPMTRWSRRGLRGVPVLAPEIVLLYKAKNPRAKDEADLANGVENLAPEARTWLVRAIERAHPDSPWLPALISADR